MVLLDTEKAYNTIWLNGILFKLISLDLPDYLLFFCKSYLKGLTFAIHLNDSTSTPESTPSGFPRGIVLSTTLFSLYPSDMPRPLHTHLALYTEDCPSFSVLAA